MENQLTNRWVRAAWVCRSQGRLFKGSCLFWNNFPLGLYIALCSCLCGPPKKCVHFLDEKSKVQNDHVMVTRSHFRKDMEPEIKNKSFDDWAHPFLFTSFFNVIFTKVKNFIFSFLLHLLSESIPALPAAKDSPTEYLPREVFLGGHFVS